MATSASNAFRIALPISANEAVARYKWMERQGITVPLDVVLARAGCMGQREFAFTLRLCLALTTRLLHTFSERRQQEIDDAPVAGFDLCSRREAWL